MVQVLKQETPWGEVAAGVGKGLGEGFDDAATRYVTSKGIGQISQRMRSDQPPTQLEIFQGLMSIPEMTPEKAQMYMPFIMAEQQRRGLEQLGGGGALPEGAADQAAMTPEMAPGAPVEMVQEKRYKGQFAEPEKTKALDTLSTLVPEPMQASLFKEKMPTDPETVAMIASQLMAKAPARYAGRTDLAEQDAAAYIQSHNQFLDNRTAKRRELEDYTDQIRDDIETRLMKRLQIDAKDVATLDKQLPPGFRENLLNRAIAEADTSNKSRQQLADEYARRGQDMVRKLQPFLDLPGVPLFAQPSDETLGRLETARKLFESQGDVEDYRAILEQKGFSRAVASGLTYPLDTDQKKAVAKWERDNKAIKDVIFNDQLDEAEWIPLQPVAFNKFKNMIRKAGMSMSDEKRAQEKDQYADKFANYLLDEVYKPGTSFEALSLLMSDQGLTNEKIYEKVSERVESGEMELTPYQQRELQAARPVDPTLVDLFNSTGLVFTQERPQMGFWEMLRRLGGK